MPKFYLRKKRLKLIKLFQNFHNSNLTIIKFKNLELLEKIAIANDKDQIIRPSFPNQQILLNNGNEEPYNMQLQSAIEACWLEIPEMRPNIKRMKTMINVNLKTT